jgi:hypothetical protein
MVKMLAEWKGNIFGAKVEDVNKFNGPKRGRMKRMGPKAMDGRELIERGRMDEQYFRMLKRAWT